MDKSSANVVANKNTRTFVKSISYTTKNTEVFNFCNDVITMLSEASRDYETGALTESELLSMIATKIVEAKELRTNVQDAKKEEKENLLNLTIECLENINVAKSSKINLISDIRYLCSSIAINMGDYV